MDTRGGRLDAQELSAVGTETTDPSLRALEVAIYVEEVLDIVLPDSVLTDARLGTPSSVAETVDAVLGEH